MTSGVRGRAVAWAESPLQLLASVEYAATAGSSVLVLPRAAIAQQDATVEALRSRGLPSSCTIARAWRVLPFGSFLRRSTWIVGEPFSGQFRLAIALIRPRTLVIVDDGSMTLHLASVLASDAEFEREAQHESAIMRMLGRLTKRAMVRLAARGRLTVFTYYPASRPELVALAGTGTRVVSNDFTWLRSATHQDGPGDEAQRIVLGSALVVDDRLPIDDYLEWLEAQAKNGPLHYYPHRRETDATKDAASRLSGVTVVQSGLPIELVLAGRKTAVEITSLPSSAIDTLRTLLAETGSEITASEIGLQTQLVHTQGRP